MITMQEFVEAARDVELHALVGCDGAFGVWPIDYSSRSEGVRDYFELSPFAAIVYPDGSAQLLSRDEDECLLFTTLWELER